MLSKLFALTTGLAATASAFDCHGNYFSFYNRNGDAMSYQRLDPALNPGTQSPHLHSFDGGNGLAPLTSFEQTQSSDCSTARIKTDKSLYWRPTLYWNGNGTGFYRVPEKSTKIYYKFGDGNEWANVTAFPEDFNMIAGNPRKRSDGPENAGVRWACHQPDGKSDPIFSNNFPTGFTSCQYGFASEITFPSCWNGEKLDPQNPNAHMAYPSGQGVGTEKCPSTHRAARFPTIFIEFWYDVSAFDGHYSANNSPWVGSNGDPTGYGFHADFLNGWEKGVLEKAIAKEGGCNCGCGCGQSEMEQCFGTANVNKDDDAEFKKCTADIAYGSKEDGAVIDKLPGCNPIQSGPADATVATGPDCTAPATGGQKTSASASAPGAIKTPAVTPSPKPSSAKASDAAPSSTKVVKEDNEPKSSPTLSTPNKGYSDTPNPTPATPMDTERPTPTPAASKPYDHPALSSAKPASPSSSSPAGEEECKPPVYVTVTPTVYVTARASKTACGLDAVTTTVTERATITVPAYGGAE